MCAHLGANVRKENQLKHISSSEKKVLNVLLYNIQHLLWSHTHSDSVGRLTVASQCIG